MSNEPETGKAGSPVVEEEAKYQANVARCEKARHKQALNLQRENILSQRTSNPVRRAALAAALEQIEAELATLG